jgi:phage terminase large subunit GpA-like protein
MTDYKILSSWLTALTPPRQLKPSEFAEQELRIPQGSGFISGPLRLTAYQKGIVDTLADDSIDTIVAMMSAQTGKSTALDAMMAYCFAIAPDPLLHISPTAAKSEEFVRDRLNALIDASPSLRAVVGTGKKGGAGDSLRHKKVEGGGQATFGSSYKPEDMAAKSCRYIVLDETDRFAQSAGFEGDPIQLSIARSKTYPNRKILLCSTPTSRFGSRIADWHSRGDQRKWMMPCPACGAFDFARFVNLVWPKGQCAKAAMRCEHCDHMISETERRIAIELGHWEATATGSGKIASFWLNELSSPFSTLESVAKGFEAINSPDAKRVFMNTTLAEVWDSAVEVSLSVSALQERAVNISSPYSASIAFVVAGIDVQGDRIECTWLAKHRDDSFSVLDHIILPGDTSANAVWLDLDALLATSFQLEDGRQLPLSAAGIDCGFSIDRVCSFVATQLAKGRRVLAVKGFSGWYRPAIKEGSRIRGQMRVHVIGTDSLKLDIMKRLAMTERGPGYIELNSNLDGTDYFDQLTSEEVTAKSVRGYNTLVFAKVGARNESLDCLVYATAISTIRNVAKKPINARPQPPKMSIAEMAKRLNETSNRSSAQLKDITYV